MNAVVAMQRFPTGLRRRLALMFVLVAGASAGALAVGASAAVTSYRHHSFRDRAHLEVQEDLAVVDGASPGSLLVPRLQRTEEPGGPGVLVAEDGVTSASVNTLSLRNVPPDLRARVGAGNDELVDGTTSISGDSYLVLGTRLPGDVEAYFFFSRADLLRGLAELRVTLLIGWIVVVAAAAIVGTLVARRTLRPVQAAADAARSVAEGLLETRLVVDSDDEFGQWAQSFNEMVAALEEKILALERARDRELRFNADVAHELRTPLGSLVTAATLVEEHADDLPAHLRRPSELVVAGARRLHRLVDELLELHRLEAGQEVVDAQQEDLTALVTAALVGHGWQDRVRLRTEGGPVVETDRRRVDRIVANLVGNALDHGGGDVTVTVAAEGTTARLVVEDRGPGIPPEALPSLFDRYYKVSRSRTAPSARAGGGSGLGLAIAAEQARLLGGRLGVTSELGRGTTFTLELPTGGVDGTPPPAPVRPVSAAGRRRGEPAV